jgi:hypothetical protein
MTAFSVLRDRLEISQRLYADLAAYLTEANLASKLPGLPSNTVGQQLWCVVGARESYTKAIAAGTWQGFSCSLKETNIKEEVAAALLRSANNLNRVLSEIKSLTEAQCSLAFQLLEHEVQHHGQLVRYLYGLKLGVPTSWKARYHLD